MAEGDVRRIVTLDALRGVGALLVLVSHVGFWSGATGEGVVGGLMARGDVGVAVFFALSAYLLGRPLLARAVATEPTEWSARRYGLHRVARILPAYYLALVGVLVVAALLGGVAAAPLDLGTVLVHLVIGQGWTGETFQSFTQSWSLTTEVTFYVLLPLVVLPLGQVLRPLSPRARARVLLVLLAAAAVLGLVAQGVAIGAARPWSGALATSALGHAAWFAVGLSAALLSVSPALLPRRLTPLLETLQTSPGTAVVSAGLVLLVASTPVAGPRDLAAPTVAEAVVKEALYAAFAGLLLLAALGRGVDEWLTGSRLALPARVLGDLSYGIFLWHVLVLQVVFAALDLPLFATGAGWLLVVVVLVSSALAAGSWWLLERPLLRRVRRRETPDGETADRAPEPAAS